MNAIVVYESLYGNTHAIAEAVGEGLRTAGEASVVPVADADVSRLGAPDLLVVGGPTHVHGMASPLSRRGAVEDALKKGLPEPDVEGPLLRAWLDELPNPAAPAAAAFDTRIDKPTLLTGSAAKGIAKRLRRHGCTIVGEQSFVVQDTDGPLGEGELDRAREWGRELARGRS